MVLNYFEIGDDTEANFKNSQLVTNGMIQQVTISHCSSKRAFLST